MQTWSSLYPGATSEESQAAKVAAFIDQFPSDVRAAMLNLVDYLAAGGFRQKVEQARMRPMR